MDMTDDVPASYPGLPLATSPAVLPTPPDQSPAVVYLESLGEGSRRTMRTALNTIAGLLGVPPSYDAEGHDVRYLATSWGSLRYQHTSTIQAQLQKCYAPATANKLLAALRRVLGEAHRLGQLSADDYHQAVELSSIKLDQAPRGRLVENFEVAALLRTCAADSTPAGARDAAVIALLRGTGLRRAEAVALDLADYASDSGAVFVRSTTEHKHHYVYAPPGTRAALDEWIVLRGDEPGPLFYGVVKGGGLVSRRLAAQAVAIICASRSAEAGVAPFTPQDLRRTYISGLLDWYDEEARHRAANLVQVPYYPQARPK